MESQTNPHNGMDFEILIDSFESHGYPHNFSLFVEIWSNKLVIINEEFDSLNQELLSFLRGHAAA